MKNSSLIKAFTLFGRKPFLLLLLLPMQALPAIVAGALRHFNTPMLTPEESMTYLLVTLGSYTVLLLFLLAGSVLLTPPAMELLQDGAADRQTAPGWYLRGLKKHWWKPVAIESIRFAINAAMIVVTYIAIFALMIALMVPVFSTAFTDPVSMDVAPQDSAVVALMVIAMCLPILLYAVASGLVSLLAALLLPASADRSFGKALKVLFSARGFRKLAKLLGVMVLIGLVSAAIYIGFGAAHVLLTGVPSSATEAMEAITRYVQSWTGLFVTLLLSVLGLYRYSYSFCLMQEIRNEEAAGERSLNQSV